MSCLLPLDGASVELRSDAAVPRTPLEGCLRVGAVAVFRGVFPLRGEGGEDGCSATTLLSPAF